MGGLLLLGLAIWLWRHKRKQRQENEKQLMAQPYGEQGSGQDVHKSSFSEGSDTEGAPAPGLASDAPVAAATGRPSPIRHLVQEEDAEEVYEYLPPRYREAWQQGPPASSTPPTTPPSQMRGLPPSSSSEPADSIPAEKQRVAFPDTAPAVGPSLKQEYARAFGTPASLSSRGRSTTPGGPRPLEEDYKRRFETSPSAETRPLKEEYKASFPSSSPPLEDEYNTGFELGSSSSYAPSQGPSKPHGV